MVNSIDDQGNANPHGVSRAIFKYYAFIAIVMGEQAADKRTLGNGNTAAVQNRRRFIKTASTASIVGLSGVAGCLGSAGGGESGPVKLGALQPMNGPFASYGQIYMQGVDFALSEVNEEGVLGGRQLEVENINTKSDPKAAASGFLELVEQSGADAILGPVSSDAGIRAAREAEKLEVPHLPNQAATTKLLSKDSRYTFRVGAIPAPMWENANAQFIQEQGYDSIGMLIADFSYGHSVNAGFERFVESLDGVEIVKKTTPLSESDFTGYIRQMPSDMDELDLIGHPSGGISAFGTALELDKVPKNTFLPNLPTPSIFNALGEKTTNGLGHFMAIDPSKGTYQDVGTRFTEETGNFFAPVAAYGYATIKLIASAIEDAGTNDPNGIRDAISQADFDTVLAYPLAYTDWGELANARAIGVEYVAESPSYAPDANFHLTKIFETETMESLDPSEWD